MAPGQATSEPLAGTVLPALPALDAAGKGLGAAAVAKPLGSFQAVFGICSVPAPLAARE